MTALYTMGVLCFVVSVLIWAVIRGGRREGEAQAKVDAAERQVDVIIQSENLDDERLSRMADAAAATVSEPADRIRQRLRQRDPRTR